MKKPSRDLLSLRMASMLTTILPPRKETMMRVPVPPKQHDPERLAAAEAKRARRAAKRVKEMQRCSDGS